MLVKTGNNNMESQSWTEFCETEAHKAAVIYAKNYRQFMAAAAAAAAANSTQTADISEPMPRDNPTRFAQRFTEHFMEHFEAEIQHGFHVGSFQTVPNSEETDNAANAANTVNLQTNGVSNGSQGSINRSIGRSSSIPTSSTEEIHHSNHQEGPIPVQDRPFSVGGKDMGRKMSFRNVRNNFRRRFWPQQEKEREREKYNLRDIVREGIINFLSGEDNQGRQRWDRTRLVLMKRNEGYVLDFYTPPKVRISCYVIL